MKWVLTIILHPSVMVVLVTYKNEEEIHSKIHLVEGSQHYTLFFSDAQGHLTLQSVDGCGQHLNYC